MIQDITLTARRDGTVTGLSVKLIANMGAYLGLVAPGVPLLGAFMYNAIYKFPAYRFECTACSPTPPRPTPTAGRAARGDVRDRADHGRARG
jgi:CO/xanthine dehydrogenase Mo-binding subunit